MAMNIYLLHHYSGPPGSGRIERQVEVARALQNGGATVTVFFASFHHLNREVFEDSVCDETGVVYRPVPCRSYQGNGLGRLANMFDFWNGIRKICGEKDLTVPDLAIASTPHPLVWLAANEFRKKFGAKIVLEVRDLWPESVIELTGASRFHPVVLLFGSIMKRAYQSSDGVVTALPGSQSYITTKFRENAVKPIEVIPNGVSLARIDRADRTCLPDEHQSVIAALREQGKLIIGYAGAMGKPNALERLIRLQEHLDETQGEPANYHFVLVGAGPERERLEKFEESRDDCIFTVLPAIAKSEVPSFLSAVDVGCVLWMDASLYRHGVSPNKVWEYFSMRIPVLWVGKTGFDPVAYAHAGISVQSTEPAALQDALLGLCDTSDAERSLMGERGRTYVEGNGDWNLLGERYRDFVCSLLADEPSSV